MFKDIKFLSGILPLCLIAASIGCSTRSTSVTTQKYRPKALDQLIAAAGFKQVFPTVPAQKVILANMPQQQMFMISKDNQIYYVYADVNGCGCLYAGNQQNYDKYQNLAADAQMIAELYQATRLNDWDWQGWGPERWGAGETDEPD